MLDRRNNPQVLVSRSEISGSEPLEARPRFRKPAGPFKKFIDGSMPAVQRSPAEMDSPA
jgi:hypothetical protein